MSAKQPTDNTPASVPDPATSYERAKPQKESPSGKLDLPKPPAPDQDDHLQSQNQSPENSKVKRP